MRDLVEQFGPLWGSVLGIAQILGFAILLLLTLAFILLFD
ncbi:MAG: hypothetical protein FD128_1626, partial [Hyphomonadaceae bacterium]